MAPAAEQEGAACPICLDVLESGTGVISLSPCGHIMHRACFDACAAAAAGRSDAASCPMCRGEVAEDRILSATAVPGALLPGDAGYAQYAPRSAVPRAVAAGAQLMSPRRRAGRGSALASPAGIPAAARDALLESISAQLGAAGAAAAAVRSATDAPSTWCFSIDVSGSMGSRSDWHPASVSRLCFALASLVRSGLAEGGESGFVLVQAALTCGLLISRACTCCWSPW